MILNVSLLIIFLTIVAAQNAGQAALPPCVLQNCEANATAASGCNSTDVYCHCTHQQPIFQVLLPCVQKFCSDPASSIASYNQGFGGACAQYNLTVPAPGINTNLTSTNGTSPSGGVGTGTGPYGNSTSVTGITGIGSGYSTVTEFVGTVTMNPATPSTATAASASKTDTIPAPSTASIFLPLVSTAAAAAVTESGTTGGLVFWLSGIVAIIVGY